MTAISEYISPELMVLIPVLYVIGAAMKSSSTFQDKHIPVILGGVSILLCTIYEFSILGMSWAGLYAGIIQGILCAGASVYVNQVYKQETKPGE